MKYYRLTYSFDKKEVGHYPQVQNITWEGRPYDVGAFGTQGLFSSKHNNPAIPSLEFYKSAKITSLIDFIPMNGTLYLVISEAFLNFLKLYFEGTFQTWKISTKHKEINYDYYIFFLDNPKSDFINYEKSIFRLFKHDEKYNKIDLNEEIKLISDQDYQDQWRKYPPIGIDKPFLYPIKIVINGYNQDFFRSSCPTMAGYYVSEKLKEDLIKNGFTGLRFQELDKINNFVEIEMS